MTEFNKRWVEYKNEFAARERDQERTAFLNDPDYHDATGPAIVNDKIVCSTCGCPVYVDSPEFDNAELLHGEI